MKRNNPWIGLASYDEKIISEGYAFCGRSTATQELFSHVDNNLFVTMYGKSGIGKSSLLQAGLFPKLRGNGYFPIYIRLGKELTGTSYSKIVTDALCNEITKSGYTITQGDSIGTDDSPSFTDDNYLWHFFATTRFYDLDGSTIFPVVVIDQMEELFFGDREQLEIFLKQIYLLLDDSPLLSGAMSDEVITNYRFLFSIREDDFFRLEDIIERLHLIEMKHNRYRLTELSDSEAKEIIEIPAASLIAQGEEDAIAMRITEAVKGGNHEISSAILSLLCSRIYQFTIGRGEKYITLNAVDMFLKGSEGNFLASFYADIIAKLNNRRKWEYIEENLVTEDGRRDSVLKSQFDTNVPDCDFLFHGEMAMLRCVTYSSNHEPHVEIIHDILAKHLKKSRNERLKKRENLKKWKTAMVFAAIIAIAVFVYQFLTILKSQEKFLITQSRYLISEAEKEYDRRNITKALRISLEALDRQYISEAEIMLRKCDSPQKEGIYSRSILQHESDLLSAQFSPDGKYIVTASEDNTARVWDAKTGKQVTEPIKHESSVNSAQFSPDGEYIVTASGDHTARVWDAKTGEQVAEPLKHEKAVNSAVFSPDGKYIVTASLDNTARVWDANTGKPVTEPLKHEFYVKSAAFSPDGKYIVTASWDNTAKVWDANTGKPVTEPLKHEKAVNSAVFSPDGKYIVTASDDNTARVWDDKTGEPVTEPLKHESDVNSAQFSPDGKYIVTASTDNTARVWDAKTGEQVIEPLEHEESVRSAQFSPDGEYIVTASTDKTARVWDAKTGEQVTEPLKHEDDVRSAQFSPDGKYIVTASYDNTARVWDAESGMQVTEPLKHESGVNSAVFSPDGIYILTASGCSATVWDAITGEQVIDLMHEDWVESAVFSPDGEYIVTASGDHTARVWDAKTGEQVAEPLKHEWRILSAQFSHDGKYIVTASSDNTARVWDAKTGQQVTEPLKHNSFVRSAAFSPDGEYIVTASDDHTARVWDAKTGEQVAEPLKHETFVLSAAFSPNGEYIVTASGDHTARVWDAKTGEPVTEPLKHEGSVLSTQFSPDGKYIVTASADHTARVWDAKTGEPVTELKHEDYVRSAAFSPDGEYIVTASGDNTARVWKFPDLQELIDKYRNDPEHDWSLTEEEKKEYSLE